MQGEDVERVKYASADGTRAIAEIHERSWLPSAPDDVLEVRTCSVATVEDGVITSLIDYADSAAYEHFLARHLDDLPKFSESGSWV
jgi:ketosteroid isomerase-like protein